MGNRFVLALGLGLAGLLPSKAFGIEHFAFGLASGTGFDVYQDGSLVVSNRPSSAEGSLTFDSTGGGTFQIVSSGETVDITPPAPITTLATTGTTETSVSLRWTATGDDGNSGTSAIYDIRYASFPITSTNWSGANQVSGEPTPQPSGTVQNYTVTGLTAGQTYYFAMKAADEGLNWSGVSNVVNATTPGDGGGTDTSPPARVTTLAVSGVTENSASLFWTAVGDDGMTGRASTYDVRYSLSAITSANFGSATPATGEPVPGVPGALQSLTVSGLASNTTYYFAMRVADEVPNWSELSNVALGTTRPHVEDPPPPDEIPPAPVTNVELNLTDSWTGQLTWTATGDDGTSGLASAYQIRRLAGTEEFPPDPTRPGAWDDALPVPAPSQPKPSGEPETWTVTSLSPGWFYTFGIRALDEADNAGPVVWSSIEQTPFTLDELPPEAVADLAVQVLDSTAVRLAWTAPVDPRSGELTGGVAGYTVARGDAPIDDGNFESAPWDSSWTGASAPGDPDRVIIDGLLPGSTIHFALRSVDPSGNISPVSNGVHVTMPRGDDPPQDPDPPGGDVTPPARVTTFTGYALGPTAMRLNWIAVGDDGTDGTATRTTIRWSSNPISEATWAGLDSIPGVPAPRPAGSVERFDWTGLELGATYYLALRVFDNAGNASPLSNVTMVVLPEIQDTAPPAVPTGLAAELANGRDVQLVWNPGGDPDLAGYLVYRRRVGETQRVTLADNLVEPAYLDTVAEPGTVYAYSVAARDVTGNLSAPCADVVISVLPDEAALVAAVRERAADPIDTQRGRLVLRWNVEPGPDLKGFRLYREANTEGLPRSSAPGPNAVEITSELLEGPGPHYFTESPLPPPGSYSYWIEAVGFSGATLYLEPLEVVVELVDAVLAVYPNPAVDRISVSFVLQEVAPVRVGVYGADGRLLYRESLDGLSAGRQEWSWGLEVMGSRNLPAGTYFLVFEAGRRVQRERFVILRGRG